MTFAIDPLPYGYDALDPYINKRTMELHHDKHHQAYCDKFNAALEGHADLQNKSAEELLRGLSSLPDAVRGAVQNHGGGYVNHAMFWQIMGPNAGGTPSGELGEAINKTFGDFDSFKTKFNNAGAGQFGSGWVWLTMDKGRMEITATPNQDSPLSHGAEVIMGNDVWEHAYYLTYENKRPEYLKNWWNVVNWDEVAKRFARAKS